jgi:hypothetical protein
MDQIQANWDEKDLQEAIRLHLDVLVLHPTGNPTASRR